MNTRILAALVLFGAAACGGNNEENSQTNNVTNNTTANNTTANNTANNTTSNNTANNTTSNNTANNTTQPPFGLSGECRRQAVDQGGDGTIDFYAVEQADDVAYQQLTTIVFDHDGDGRFDQAIRNSYDSDGRYLAQDVDNDADGVFDEHSEGTYDANGNPTGTVVSDDAGEMFVATLTYDAEGRLLTRTLDGNLGSGARPDGNPDFTETFEYVGDRVSLHEIDTNGDGEPEFRLALEFDANDRWTFRTRDGRLDPETQEVVQEADGIPDEEETLTRGADGYVTYLESDGDVGPNREQADGTPDLIQRNFTWENDRILYVEQDGRGDVTNDFVTEVANGTFDSYTGTYDANGWRTTWILDEGMDGTDDVVDRTTFDADGMLLTLVRDGVIDNNQIVSEPADGVDNFSRTLTWHAPNYLASQTVDADGDGVEDFIHELTWANTSYGEVLTSQKVDGGHWINEVPSIADGVWDFDLTLTLDDQERTTDQLVLRNGSTSSRTTWEYGPCSDFL